MTDAVAAWLDSVVSGEATMTQRGARWVNAQGGLEPIVQAATARGVHLLRLTDDKGQVLVAASLNPFEVLC